MKTNQMKTMELKMKPTSRYRFKKQWIVTRAIVLVLFISLFVNGCKTGSSDDSSNPTNPGTPTPDFQLAAQGSGNTLEIATWNLQNFPLNRDYTVQWIATIIRQLDIDIFAVQEIADIDVFQQLLDELNGYAGLYSDDVYGDGSYQKTGIIYKQDLVTIQSRQMLFTNDTYAFPRPPLLVNIAAENSGRRFDFFLVILHLKAFDGQENLERRRAAAAALKTYIDGKIADPNEVEKDYIVAGDWNDQIDDPVNENAFQVFIDEPLAYSFVTLPLAGDAGQASYPSRNSLIDHILISADCFFEYQGGTIRTLRLDDQVNRYSSYVSDHRPVMVVFPVFQ